MATRTENAPKGAAGAAAPATRTITRTLEAGDKDKEFAASPVNGAAIRFVRPAGNDTDAVQMAVASGAFASITALLHAAYTTRDNRILSDIKRKAVGKDGKAPEIADADAAQRYADTYKFEATRVRDGGEVPESRRKAWERYQKQLTPAIAAGVFGAEQLRFLVSQGQIDPAWADEQIAKLNGATK